MGKHGMVMLRPPMAMMHMNDSLTLMESGVASLYLDQLELPVHAPVLSKDVSLPWFARSLRVSFPMIWLSTGNVTTGLHADFNDNMILPIIGRREVLLFDPDQRARLNYDMVTRITQRADSKTTKADLVTHITGASDGNNH